MNDHVLIVGEMKGKGNGYFAMWGNDDLVVQGDTPEKAIIELMYICYPTIWQLNNMDNEDDSEERVGENYGMCLRWFNRKKNKPIGEEIEEQRGD